MATQKLIHTDGNILGGTPVFSGTRVPVQTLIDYLEEGKSLLEFLADFPSVSRAKAVAVLRILKKVVAKRHARAV